MKNGLFCSIFVFSFVAIALSSCVSLTDKTMSLGVGEKIEITGKVRTTFTTYQFFHVIRKEHIMEKAYSRLLAQAQDKYGYGVDVINITIEGRFSGHNFWFMPFWWFFGVPLIVQNFQRITVMGDVIELNSQRQNQINGPKEAVIEDIWW